MQKLLIFPFGGNAREALAAMRRIDDKTPSSWNVLGFADDDPTTWGKECLGAAVLGGREILTKFQRAKIIAVPGSPQSYSTRKNLIDSLTVDKNRFVTVIDRTARISPDARIGYNTLIMANAVVGCGVTVGNHCIILPNTVISHESRVGDYCCIGSNVSISGGAVIQEQCYIGSGSVIREGIVIGGKSLLGLGSVIIADIPPAVEAVGNPARILKEIS
jgi:sugar O-acyltransferase (sialic acid O-acetyltransferase NeuD family)